MKISARSTALRVLVSCRTNGAWADAALKAQLARDGLSRPDAALCSRIVYGVMQNRMLLDHYIGAYCTQKPEHLQPPLLDILRIGAYQILYLDKIPDSAAVNTSVELAKTNKRGQAAGLVNAVLRKLSKNKNQLPELPGRDEVQLLSTQYSHPKWLVEEWLMQLGEKECTALLSANNAAPGITAQVNTRRISTSALVKELSDRGVHVQVHPWLSDCLILGSTGSIERLYGFAEGLFYFQDPASCLAVSSVAPCADMRVLDVCAAPGGKSFAAAIAMNNLGQILSCDLHPHKKKLIEAGAKRLGLDCISAMTAYASEFHEEWQDRFDLVIADVPCSGLGVIRKKPDIRFKDPTALDGLCGIQAGIIRNAARYVKPGGILLYSTCTLREAENGRVVHAFLDKHTDYELKYEHTFMPHIDGTDGFYCALIQKSR